MIFIGVLALLLSPFGVFSVSIAAITAAICQARMRIPMPASAG